MSLVSVVICLMISTVDSLNILVWSPTYGQSHVNFMGNIADTLYDAGHNVVSFTIWS